MKNLFLTIGILFSASLLAQTQTKSKKVAVPANVKEAFSQDYPAKKAKWGMEDGDYEAEFKINGTDASAVYDKTGHRKEMELDIKTTELPAGVIDYITKTYPSEKITEAAKITNDKNNVTFEVEIRKNGKSSDLLFDTNGKFIKMVTGD